MNNYKKVGMASLIGGAVLLSAAPAKADLASAFDGVLATHSPGTTWEGAGRFGYVGSSGAIRFRQSNITLFSVTPPSFSAGCGGISWSLGGFDFIDGEELVEFFQAAGQAAAGQVVLLAAKTLCEPCAQTLAYIQELSQAAAQTSMDSCRVGQSLAEKGWSMLPSMSKKDGASNTCHEIMASTGETEGFWSSVKDGVCSPMNGMASITEGLNDLLEVEDMSDAESEMAEVLKSNPIWWVMRKGGVIPQVTDDIAYSSLSGDDLNKLAMAEVMNAIYWTNGGIGSSSAEVVNWGDVNNTKFEEREGSVADAVISFMLCGSDFTPDNTGPHKSDALEDFCETKKELFAELQVPTCSKKDEPTIFMGETCNPLGNESKDPEAADFVLTPLLGGEWLPRYAYAEGVVEKVHKVFETAYQNISEGKSPADNNDYLLFMMDAAPFDLYRVLNVASVNMQAAKQITEPMEIYISYAVIKGYLNSMLSNMNLMEKTDGDAARRIAVSNALQKTYESLKEDMIISNGFQIGLMTDLTFQEQIMTRVVSIEQQVAKEVSVQQIRQGKKYQNAITIRGE